MYITICEIDHTPGSMHETGCSGMVHWEDLRDGMGREVGGGFRMGKACTPVVDSCEYYGKSHHNIVK